MKIAMVSPYDLDHPGGVQDQARSLVTWLRDEGHDAWLVAPGTAGGPAGSKYLGETTKVRANRSVARVRLSPGTSAAVAEGIAGADVVHIHEPFVPAVALAALRVPGVRRIGHGIQAASDTALLNQVARAEVALECCPTSNVILGAIPTYETHPLPDLVQAGVKVTINTDNPVRFNTNISREYELAGRLGLTAEDLARASGNAIDFAFTSEDRKRILREPANTERGS